MTKLIVYSKHKKILPRTKMATIKVLTAICKCLKKNHIQEFFFRSLKSRNMQIRLTGSLFSFSCCSGFIAGWKGRDKWIVLFVCFINSLPKKPWDNECKRHQVIITVLDKFYVFSKLLFFSRFLLDCKK